MYSVHLGRREKGKGEWRREKNGGVEECAITLRALVDHAERLDLSHH